MTTVYRCGAYTCKHNHERRCEADEITLDSFGDCETYEARGEEEEDEFRCDYCDGDVDHEPDCRWYIDPEEEETT